MAGRPPLPLGTHGTVRVQPYRHNDAGDVVAWQALTYYRDVDGETRRVSRTGKTKAAAKRSLQEHLADRQGVSSKAGMSADTRMRDLAPVWLESIQRQVDAERRSPGTVRLYTIAVNKNLLPLMGGLTLREANNVTRCDEALISIADNVGAPSAKTARAALSGMLGLAIRRGWINPPNPVRECSPISIANHRVRALTVAERRDLLNKLEADQQAKALDLPDLTRMMLATGCRIAEMLAVTFDDIDLTTREISVDWQITRINGQGLVRRQTKTRAGERTLVLPLWAIETVLAREVCFGYGPLFPHHTARRHLDQDRSQAWRDPSNTSKAFREARDRVGYPWLTSHSFRRTVATDLDNADLSARKISDQLGHSRIATTQNSYLQRRCTGHDAADALESLNPDS